MREILSRIRGRVGEIRAGLEYDRRLRRVRADLNQQVRLAYQISRSAQPGAVEAMQGVVQSINDLTHSLKGGERIGFDLMPETFERLEQSGDKPWFSTYQYTDLERDEHHLLYVHPSQIFVDAENVLPLPLGARLRVVAAGISSPYFTERPRSFSFSPDEVVEIRVDKPNSI